jgi:signal transduction histidine kinase
VAELPMIIGGMFVAFEFLIYDAEHSLRIGPELFKISVVLEILLFSFALGNKYREQRLLLTQQLELNEQLKIQKLEDLKILSDQKNKELAFLVEQRTKELNETNEDLIKLNKEKNKIFSILGHDLRSPLASLIMMLDLFNSADLTEEDLKEMVSITKSQLVNLNNSIENLFSWAQSQMEGLTINQIHYPLKELIEEKINLLNIAAIKKKIFISFDDKEDLIAFTDKNHIGIIIQNVLSNAIKFTRENGLIKIELLQKANMAIIKITDNGIGMKEELIKKINSDQLVKSSKGTAGEKGTGLGLFLCKEMIAKNNGSMIIESVQNEGTTIILKLPLYKNNIS